MASHVSMGDGLPEALILHFLSVSQVHISKVSKLKKAFASRIEMGFIWASDIHIRLPM